MNKSNGRIEREDNGWMDGWERRGWIDRRGEDGWMRRWMDEYEMDKVEENCMDRYEKVVWVGE